MTHTNPLRGAWLFAVALAAALGVALSMAAFGGGTAGAQSPSNQTIQTQQPEQDRPERDCPKEGGASGSGSPAAPSATGV
jgi:hypothetical protein